MYINSLISILETSGYYINFFWDLDKIPDIRGLPYN